MKIPKSVGGGSVRLGNQNQPSTAGAVQPHPMAVLLFGKRPPRRVDPRRFPGLKKALRKLGSMRDQLAELVGRQPSDLSLALCEGNNASISRAGEISLGVELLAAHQGDDDLLLGILGHEVGHQPWSWPRHNLAGMSRVQLDLLYREEEAKADRFAGRVLAELGGDPQDLCEFLLTAESFEARKPTDYYPAEVREEIIRKAFARRRSSLLNRRTLLGG
jgi:hypothetical protein